MINKRKQKSPALRDSVQKRIAEYALKNPDVSRSKVALKHGCTARQVLYAEERYKAGDFDGKGKKDTVKRARLISEQIDASEAFSEELKMVMAQLKDEELTATQRAVVLEKYMNMRRHQQAMELESHIKRTDAAIIKLIVQKFKPDATDDDVIKIYSEAMEQWKYSLK